MSLIDRDELGVLPPGWAWVHFGEVVEHRLGKMLDKAKNRGTLRPYLRNVNVRWHDFDLSDVLEMRLEDDELEEYSVRRGDVLICEGGEPGRSAVWQREEPMYIQKALHRARPRAGIEPKLIVYLLEDAAQTGRLTSSFTGSTIQHLTGQALADFELPLPPLSEQRRIVAKLDELLSDVDAGVEALQAAKRDLARYRKSVLKAAVEGNLTAAWRGAHGPATEPADALLARILTERRARWEADQLAKYTEKGQTPPKDWQSRYTEPAVPDTSDLPELPEGWTWASVVAMGDVQLGRQRSPKHHTGDHMRPYLRVANVFDDRIDTSDVMEMNFTPEEFETYRLHYGDILLNEGQSPELVGRPAMYRDEVPGACFQNTLVRFKSDPEIDRAFALIVFRAYLHTGRFKRMTTQTVNIAHLGAGRFAAMEFPLPPKAEQEAIVAEVERRLSITDAAAQEVDAALTRAAQLRQRLLRHAFEGRLVPQDPADEPASEVLARIKTKKAKTPTGARRNRRSTIEAQAELPL